MKGEIWIERRRRHQQRKQLFGGWDSQVHHSERWDLGANERTAAVMNKRRGMVHPAAAAEHPGYDAWAAVLGLATYKLPTTHCGRGENRTIRVIRTKGHLHVYLIRRHTPHKIASPLRGTSALPGCLCSLNPSHPFVHPGHSFIHPLKDSSPEGVFTRTRSRSRRRRRVLQ